MKNKKVVQIGAILAIALFIGFIIFSSLQPKNPGPSPNNNPSKPITIKRVKAPEFSADSAYNFIQNQVDFGPRVPNSEGAKNCGDWLVKKLTSYSDNVIEQTGVVTAYNGKQLNMRNIIAEFQPEKKKRLLLYAHWDTRPWADKDTSRIKEPIDGANDGGSGVGVLLEIARKLKETPTDYGVDIIFFDTEDYGTPQFERGTVASKEEDWCLGSQYWSKKPHKPGYTAKYGILLDMVGAEGAEFPQEEHSRYYAQALLDKVWKSAKNLGYSNYFSPKSSAGAVDDHKFVNEIRKIQSIDIIEYHVNAMGSQAFFGSFHHTHRDNMDIISKETLQAVGDVVMDVIYNE